MDKNTAIKDIDPEVKRRINYLVHKTENCDGDIPIKDLEILREIQKGAKNDYDKIANTYAWVQQNIRCYVKDWMEERGYY